MDIQTLTSLLLTIDGDQNHEVRVDRPDTSDGRYQICGVELVKGSIRIQTEVFNA